MTTLRLRNLHDQLVSKEAEPFLTQTNLDFLMNDTTARRLAKVYSFTCSLPVEEQCSEEDCYYNDLVEYIEECLGEASFSYEEITFPEDEDDVDYYESLGFDVSCAFATLLCDAVKKPYTAIAQNLTSIPSSPKLSGSASATRKLLWGLSAN